MTNIARIRAKDKIKCINERIYEVKEVWSAGSTFQLITEEFPDQIWTYNIHGQALGDLAGCGYTIAKLIETKLPDDDVAYYIPRFETEFLPVLKVNGEEKIIMQLLDLNGLEIKEPQKLEAMYKYVIVAMLNKKLGRDITNIKTERIICESKEECEEKLEKISAQFTGEKPENFDKELKGILNG